MFVTPNSAYVYVGNAVLQLGELTRQASTVTNRDPSPEQHDSEEARGETQHLRP